MTNRIRNHMLLIPGLLRCVDDNLLRFLDSASAYAEIFIVTEKSFSQEVALLIDRYDAKAWYSEDMVVKYERDPSLFPSFFSQWLKFDYALNQALEWEEANGLKFEFIHRIRTDVTFPDKFYELMIRPLENKDASNICMLNVVDYCFSARRDALPSLLKLASFIRGDLLDDTKLANILKFVNIDQLKQSEMRSASYSQAFPVGILAGNQTPDEFYLLLKEKYSPHSFIEAAAAFALSLSDQKSMSYVLNLALKSSYLIRDWNGDHCCILFPGQALARFYNFFGIYTYSYSGEINLKESRQANSDFTFNILRMVDNNDVSFLLDTEIDWEKGINDFVKNGGCPHKLSRVFIDLIYKHFSKFEDFQYSKLAIIFKILAKKFVYDLGPPFNENFRLFASERGLKLPSTDFYEYARSAQELVTLKRFVEAQTRVQEGIDKFPNQIYLLKIANDVCRASGNLEKSLEYASILILHHPSDCNGYLRSAQDLVALKRFDEAQAKVQEGLNNMPNQFSLLAVANDVCRALGNREKSLEYANSLILHYPSDWIGYGKSSQDLAALNRFDEAQARVQEGLNKVPNQINLLYIANDVYRASGNQEKALEYANSLILHHPGDWNGYGRSAQDLVALKRFDEAQAKIQEGLSKMPSQINLLHIANDVCRASGNREKSLVYANSLIFHHPSDWSGYGRSAQDLAALNLFEEAQARVQEGLNKLPNQINILQIASDICRASGSWEKSLDYANTLILHYPSDWIGYGKSAQDLVALKRFEEAQAIVQEGLNKLPNQFSLLYIANDVYRASGNREKSLDYANSLVLNYPSDWIGYGKSAQDLVALKRFDEAQVRVKEGLDRLPNQINLLQIANDIDKALGKPG